MNIEIKYSNPLENSVVVNSSFSVNRFLDLEKDKATRNKNHSVAEDNLKVNIKSI